MRDLISIDDLNIEEINYIHDLALNYQVNSVNHSQDLQNKILVNFFFENSRISSKKERSLLSVKFKRIQSLLLST